MSNRPIGYYVHHHGEGHRDRAAAIMAASEQRIVLLGTGIGNAGVSLPDDCAQDGVFDGNDAVPSRPDALHYAPFDQDGIRHRIADIANWIAQERPVLMVVDVSVEVAMLARLCSVPTIYVRLGGERNDPAHLDAFKGASGLLAPFHRRLEAATTPDWVCEKTCYLPGIARLPAEDTAIDRCILVVFGRGGEGGDGEAIAEAARACPDWHWRVIGPASPPDKTPSNLKFAGWVADPEREIARAAVVVGGAGSGLVGAVMAADRPFVCIPEDRPFREQFATGDGLKAMGAAIVLPVWPSGRSWLRIISDALALPSAARQEMHDPGAARKAASWLALHAAGAGRPPEVRL